MVLVLQAWEKRCFYMIACHHSTDKAAFGQPCLSLMCLLACGHAGEFLQPITEM